MANVPSPSQPSSAVATVSAVPLAAVAWQANARAGASQPARNPGVAFDASWFEGLRANRSAVERRTATLTTRRSLKRDAQAAWLLKAITCIDLTTLNGDDTAGRVRRLCAKARRPVRDDILEALGIAPGSITTGAVCVYHRFVAEAVDALAGSGIPVAAVSAGFPAGLIPHSLKLREIDASVRDGAAEIDVVVTREHVLTGNWQAMYDEVRDFRAACGEAHLKAILATGDIQTLANVAKASMVCMMAGADFIKTSTGKEGVNATLDVSLVMVRMIRDYFERTGTRVGFKPAGGVSSAKGVLGYQILMKEELGRPWLEPELFRIGASSLLGDIERQLEHHISGRYSAFNRHPLA
jgi:deoxyribose-phosphate aldolase